MRILVVVGLAAGFMLTSSAMACPYADKMAAAAKTDKAGCTWKGQDKVAKASGCQGCTTFHKAARGLRAAGAQIEVVRTKRGYIMLATAESPAVVKTVREVNADHLKILASMGNGNGKNSCKDCTAFSKAVKSGAVQYEEVALSNGVMMVYTASTDAGEALLKARCGSSCRLKASADLEQSAINN